MSLNDPNRYLIAEMARVLGDLRDEMVIFDGCGDGYVVPDTFNKSALPAIDSDELAALGRCAMRANSQRSLATHEWLAGKRSPEKETPPRGWRRAGDAISGGVNVDECKAPDLRKSTSIDNRRSAR